MSILLFRSKTTVVKNPMKGSEKLIESIEGKKLSYRMVGIGERVLHQGFSLLKPNCTIFPHKSQRFSLKSINEPNDLRSVSSKYDERETNTLNIRNDKSYSRN